MVNYVDTIKAKINYIDKDLLPYFFSDCNIEYIKDDLIINEDWKFVSNRIKAEVANVLWKREDFYKALTYNDLQVKVALDQFINAEKLLNQK